MSDSTIKPTAAAAPAGGPLKTGEPSAAHVPALEIAGEPRAVTGRPEPVPERQQIGHQQIGRQQTGRQQIGEPSPPQRTRSAVVRTIFELCVCLVILVALFRTFLAGGYMIETGSMAPCLLGYHRQVTCPSCHYPFAVEGSSTKLKAVCPNCGRKGIPVDGLLRNDGDHLLVHRGTYEFRRPRRWEVIVFRNPNKPTQAYVKRLVALPGESLQIKGGDVYISGQIQAKDYATQRGLRIPVYDHDFRPAADEIDWQPRWVVDQPGLDDSQKGRSQRNQSAGGWQSAGGSFRFTPRKKGGPDTADRELGDHELEDRESAVEWVHYRHWIRQGGSDATSVPFAGWTELEAEESIGQELIERGLVEQASIDPPATRSGTVSYDAENKMLVCRGVLSAQLRDRLLASVLEGQSRRSIERLYEASHIAPIMDTYGYNWGRDGLGRHEVRDLMLSAQVRLHDGAGEFVLAITDGAEEFQCVFDVPSNKVRLVDVRSGKTLKTGSLNERMLEAPVSVEISLMDRQVLLAVGGKLPFEPYRYSATRERGPTPWRPVRFGARGAAVEISSLKLFRDVYYTDEGGRLAVDGPLQLKPDEYFVLGDNSPVSKDSRSWSKATVLSSDLLLGKPLAVHLPSKKRRFQIGGWEREIRIPEISRIRYIH